MEITTSVDGNKTLFKLEGKLTVQTSPELTAAVDDLPEEVCDIVIDLSDVIYVASAGLRALVGTNKLALKRGGHMTLLKPREEVWEVFEMTGLSEVFDIER